MKKTLVVILFLFQLNCINAQSFIYHPFPADSADWFQKYWGMPWPNGSTFDVYYKILGDTTINSVAYKKVYNARFQNPPPFPLPPKPSYALSGAIRQDIGMKKVYYRPFAGQVGMEQVLYDFNISIGDTISQIDRFGDAIPSLIVVTGIDSVLVNNKYNRSFVLYDYFLGTPGKLIEGVGNEAGLFECYAIAHGGLNYYNADLKCFSVKTDVLYPPHNAGPGYSCQLVTSIEQHQSIEYDVSVFPNPTNGKVELSVKGVELSYFEITNILGEVVLKSGLINNKTEVDLSRYKNGIYFMSLFDTKGNVVVKKIVKQ